MRTRIVLKFIGFGILGLVAISFFTCITMHLWNWLVPMLFLGPIITFWQTAGLLLLSKIFFSGFGCCGRHGRKHHSHFHENCCNDKSSGQESWWKKFHERCGCNENAENKDKCC